MPYVALEDSGVDYNFVSPTGALVDSVATLLGGPEDNHWSIQFPDWPDELVSLRVTPLVYAPPPTEDDFFRCVGVTGYEDVQVFNGTPAGPGWTPSPTELVTYYHNEWPYPYFDYSGRDDALETQFLIEVFMPDPPPTPCFWEDVEGATQNCVPE